VLRFRILGPFEVVNDEPLSLGGRRQRAVLLALLIHRGEVVSRDRLIDEVWGESAPATAVKTLHVYVSTLRKALGEGVLVTRDGGYVLAVDRRQVDCDQFDELVARGRYELDRGTPWAARMRLQESLDLWRGPPMADFAFESFAQPEISRLAEARLATIEDRIEADLALGRDAVLVPELEALVREHPLRERLWSQLMLALYRSGRQADALERYQRARGKLLGEFGIEPGPRLKQIERSILAQDEALDMPAPASRLNQLRPTWQRLRRALGRIGLTVERLRRRGLQPRMPIERLRPRLRRLGGLRSTAERVIPRGVGSRQRTLLVAGVFLALGVVIGLALSGSGSSDSRAGGSHRGTRLGATPACGHCVASISFPSSGRVYTVAEPVATRFSCSETGGGRELSSCTDSTGTNTPNRGQGHLDTSTPGPHTYTVTATSKNRGTRTSSISYTVAAPIGVFITTARARVAQRRAGITLSCSGGIAGTNCRGMLSLTMTRLFVEQAGHHRTVTFKRVTIASEAYVVSTGARGSIVVQLTPGGLLALRRAPRHQREARVLATLTGGKTIERTITLHL
jgi:DNA-binding SARP family transcriptional activator